MTDETGGNGPPPSMEHPPLRDTHVISDEAVTRWLAIPENAQIQINITRGDFDNLYFAIQKAMRTEVLQLICIREIVRGNKEEVERSWLNSLEQAYESMDHLGLMMEAVMRKAVRVDG